MLLDFDGSLSEIVARPELALPVEGAREEMEKIDPELAKSPFIFPDAAYLRDNNIQIFRALSPEEEAEYSEAWAKVVGN